MYKKDCFERFDKQTICGSCEEVIEDKDSAIYIIEEHKYYHPECVDMWICSGCGFGNEDGDSRCSQCGDSREEAK